jgi:phytoene dehydrogenase-like protein
MNNLYDVIVVGGGHNGLVSACYLAEEGKRVLVLEAADKLGGMSASGYLIPEAPEHMIHSCALDLMSLRVHPMVPEELQLSRHGFKQVEVKPGYIYCHPDGETLAFGRTAEATAAEIARFSSNDAQEFIELMKLVNVFLDMAIPMMRADPARFNFSAKLQALTALLKNIKLKSDVMDLIQSPAYTSIIERFEHPVTQSALCALLGAAGPISNEGTGVFFALLGFIHRFGIGRAVGGMQMLPNALEARLNELNGEVRVSSPVSEIVAEQGQVKGVVLADGSRIDAKVVIAAIHPKSAFEMVTPGAFDRKVMTRVALAPANAHGAAPMKIDLALNGQISYTKHEAKRTDGLCMRNAVILVGTSEAVLDNFKCAAAGKVSDKPYFWATAPTAVDPSQAPVGQDVVYIYPIAMPVEPTLGWDSIRADTAQQMVDFTAKYMDGIKEYEIARRIEASPDLADRLKVHRGCVVHIDTGITRSGLMRPAAGLGSDKLPVDGFFLGGAGIHPGGGVNGLPGRITAARVKRYLKK